MVGGAEPRIVTLTTDFGLRDAYVAQLKGVLLSRAPGVLIVDNTHEIPAQDRRAASVLLADLPAWFPPGTVHLVAVDGPAPGGRAALAVELAGQFVVGPDNGVLTHVLKRFPPRRVHQLAGDEPTSATFLARDVLAPAAAALAIGVDLADLGPAFLQSPVEVAIREPRLTGTGCVGEVERIDAFGNLVSNIPGEWISAVGPATVNVRVGAVQISGLRRGYGDVAAGELMAYVGSSGTLEVAVSAGSAAEELQIRRGTEIRVRVSEV